MACKILSQQGLDIKVLMASNLRVAGWWRL